MEPNSEAFEGPTASIWIDFHFVTKSKDELTTNHRGTDKEETAGIMPETPGSECCPVISFEKYINKLHPSYDHGNDQKTNSMILMTIGIATRHWEKKY